jgi:hypothetical protein
MAENHKQAHWKQIMSRNKPLRNNTAQKCENRWASHWHKEEHTALRNEEAPCSEQTKQQQKKKKKLQNTEILKYQTPRMYQIPKTKHSVRVYALKVNSNSMTLWLIKIKLFIF